MSKMQDPRGFYQSRISELNELVSRLNRKKNFIAWARLASVFAIILSSYFFWYQGFILVFSTAVVLFILFLRFVVIDSRNNAAIENAQRLIDINKEELNIGAHHFLHREDGSEFVDGDHDYALDMDIFGRASLYQFVNRAKSEQGKNEMAEWLLNPADYSTILQRQEAVQELSEKVQWRQQLQAYGIGDHLTNETQQKIFNWLNEMDTHLRGAYWKYLRFILPGVILAILVLHVLGFVSPGLFYTVAFIFLLLSGYTTKLIKPLYENLNKVAGQVETLSNSAEWIESAKFRSGLLQQIRNNYFHGNVGASKDIRHLKKILDRFDLRLNPLVFVFLNTFLFWDLQQVFALEKWKSNHRTKINGWFKSLAELEAFSSLANLAFNYPSWCYPSIADEPEIFRGDNFGHPLIDPARLVRNSFSSEGQEKISIVTGSNMAGKSTFLRSVGINIVLAMTGSKVCADSLTLSHLKLMSSMRINDNLEESTSTFYAELKKIRRIVTAVNQGEKIFILLDEILRGTNSTDRQTGSKALIKQLVRHRAAGIVATHDLELARLTEEFPGKILNYHFDVQMENDELFFDYKLKEGICKTFNASLLMKNMGIEL